MNVGTQYPSICDVREHLHIISTTLKVNSKFLLRTGQDRIFHENVTKSVEIQPPLSSGQGEGHSVCSRYSAPAGRERLDATKVLRAFKYQKSGQILTFYGHFS